jgi:lipopolysaccharide/colanic/teichoic acid biosynthesis glycosyltransferase
VNNLISLDHGQRETRDAMPLDLVGALLLLVLASPLLAVIAVALRLEDYGPILYRSPRVGRGGQPFSLLRFRTMLDTPEPRGVEQRLTPVGRLIRNISLDDLPNLINVLRGEMSLVGPRPMEPEHVDLSDPAWQRILSVRPGMVSFAILQLARRYNASDAAAKNALELRYVQQRSLGYDLALFRRALRALVASRGNIKARGAPAADRDGAG